MPTYGRQPCLEFGMLALATNALLNANGISTVWRYVGGDPYVHKARNKLASEFLTEHRDAEALFFLDDDLGWEADAALRFCRRGEAVICGVYPKKNDGLEFPVQLTFNRDGSPIVQDGLYLALLAPTGFMRIRREVLERCAEDSGIYEEPDLVKGMVECWDLFRTGFVPLEEGGKRGRWWGEDFFFSVMVRQLGMEVWVDPNIEFTHRGSKAWKARFDETLQRTIMDIKAAA